MKHAHPIIAVIGLGLWGQELLRVTSSFGVDVLGCDTSAARRKVIKRMYPSMRIFPSVQSIFAKKDVQAVIIATPPETHYEIAKESLKHDLHVLVEKPMTQHTKEAHTLVSIAKKSKKILMVDHTYVYAPVIQKMTFLIANGAIGDILQIESRRCGPGRVYKNSSVLWDLVPHDISIGLALLGTYPTSVRAFPPQKTTHQTADARFCLFYPKGITMFGHVSWISPIKERILSVTGTKGTLIAKWADKKTSLTLYQTISSPISFPREEPLKRMIRAFLESIATGKSPVTDGAHAESVVRAISAIEQSWHTNGKEASI